MTDPDITTRYKEKFGIYFNPDPNGFFKEIPTVQPNEDGTFPDKPCKACGELLKPLTSPHLPGWVVYMCQPCEYSSLRH